MSTANFAIINARNYYVVSDFPEDLEDVASRFPSWYAVKNGPGAWENTYLSRSYPSRAIMEKSFRVELSAGNYYDLEAKIIIRSGYYSGATFDWDLAGDSYTGAMSDYNGCSSDFAEIIVSGYLDDMEYYHGWNKGIQAIMRPRFLARVTKALEEMIQECENICSELCEETLICVGRFSNGEAVYKKAS